MFNDQDLISIHLNLDKDLIFEQRNMDKFERNYFDIDLTLDDKKIKNAKIKVIGGSRLLQCNLPPFKLKMNKASYFFNTHCDSRYKLTSQHEEMKVVREYLVYKIFNILYPYSFQVRLAKVYYNNNSTPHYAFLSESTSSFEKRTGLKKYNHKKSNQRKINSKLMAQASLIQGLIGNQDYRINLTENYIHNTSVFEDGNNTLIPTFYDFDYSRVATSGLFNRYIHELNTSCIKISKKDLHEARREIRNKKNKLISYLESLRENPVFKEFNFIDSLIDSLSNPLSQISSARADLIPLECLL